MSNDQPSIQVRFTNEFQQQVRDLAKRYRKIQSDIQPLIQQLEAGEISDEQVQATGYVVFKVRSNRMISSLLGKSCRFFWRQAELFQSTVA